jgi:hypothetical protein
VKGVAIKSFHNTMRGKVHAYRTRTSGREPEKSGPTLSNPEALATADFFYGLKSAPSASGKEY